jgi:hypothetical protein
MKRRTVTKSPAQRRQQHLFQRKGQIASVKATLWSIAWDVELTPILRDHAHTACQIMAEAEKMFNKEVGWK